MAFPEYTTVIDDFNRADEGPPASSEWSNLASTDNGFKVSSNTAIPASGANANGGYHNVGIVGPDGDWHVTIPDTGAGGTRGVSIHARLQNPGTSSRDGYSCSITFSSSSMVILRWDNETSTQLGSSFTSSFLDGNKLGFRLTNTTLQGYRWNGIAWTMNIERTDSSYGAEGYVGLNCADTTASGMHMDDFIGDTTVGPVPPVRSWTSGMRW